MINTLKQAKGNLTYLQNNPNKEDKYYETDLESAQSLVYRLTKVFALELDVVVPTMCYLMGFSSKQKEIPIIDQVKFPFQGQEYVYLYLVSLRNQEIVKKCLLNACNNLTETDNVVVIFNRLSKILGGYGVTVYPANKKPIYLCLPEHYEALEEIPNKAVLLNQNNCFPLFVNQILRGRFNEVMNSLVDAGRFADINGLQKTLPEYYRKRMITMPKD